MCQHTDKFGISSRLQEIISLLGQSQVFEEASEILEELTGVIISAKQIQRVSEYYGDKLEDLNKAYDQGLKPAPVLDIPPSDTVYAMVDGSMVLIREQGWKEIKVGRVYGESSRVAIQPGRQQVSESLYVCHLGNNKDFFNKFDPYIDHYKRKVIIGDGAKWIWSWAGDYHSDALQILDFFHAVEKLGTYAAAEYADDKVRNRWLDKQKLRLKNNEVLDIINELSSHTARNNKAARLLMQVVGYYQSNAGRMQYKTYLEQGYLIGSGAIESAHRNVIQQRLKLSGQRWSVQGVQAMANLRACKKANQWKILIDCIKGAA